MPKKLYSRKSQVTASLGKLFLSRLLTFYLIWLFFLETLIRWYIRDQSFPRGNQWVGYLKRIEAETIKTKEARQRNITCYG